MRGAFLLALWLCLVTWPVASQQGVPSSATPAALDYEFFKSRVQPIFLAKRSGHARCISCHASGTPLRLQPLASGSSAWNEEDTRKNFEAVRRVVVPGNVKSKLLVHPLAEEAGGDFYHNGGKHWSSQNDAEWQTLKTWVLGQTASSASAKKVRIIQTNSAGDDVDIIDPVTNKVVGVITGIEVNHGAAVAPDGSRIYVSDEAESSLAVADAQTFKVIKRIPLSGHPNNIAVGRDGRRVYVGIIQAPGGVDVIDTASLQRVKTIPTKGTIHNAYVTPDGKYVVAGSIQGKTVNVIDAQTEQPVWTLEMDLGIRPMTFNSNPDG
ncbi:MAG TPA: YncE family protein, partial [Vicinamibacterales bacterium]|nr:YncE family protein [Vicinamibacterales bacterium]